MFFISHFLTHHGTAADHCTPGSIGIRSLFDNRHLFLQRPNLGINNLTDVAKDICRIAATFDGAQLVLGFEIGDQWRSVPIIGLQAGLDGPLIVVRALDKASRTAFITDTPFCRW